MGAARPRAPLGPSTACAPTPILTCPSLREAHHHSAAQAHLQHTARRRARVPAPATPPPGWMCIHHARPRRRLTKLPPACLLPALNSPGHPRPGRRTRHHAAEMTARTCALRRPPAPLAPAATPRRPASGLQRLSRRPPFRPRPRDPPPPPGLAGGTWPHSAPALLLQPPRLPRREACPLRCLPGPGDSADGERRSRFCEGSPTTRRGSSPLRRCRRAARRASSCEWSTSQSSAGRAVMMAVV